MQSPFWEANRRSGNKKIPQILWNPKVHFFGHKSLLMGPLMFYITFGKLLNTELVSTGQCR